MIKIVRGVYGYLDKDGIVRPRTEADAPFELQPEQEERLVRLGIAQYAGFVKAAAETAENVPSQEPSVGDATEQEDQDPELEDTQVVEIPLSEYSVKELRELGKEYGLSFKVGMTKDDMVKAIEAAEAALEADMEEDGESAPVFDASEAVQ